MSPASFGIGFTHSRALHIVLTLSAGPTQGNRWIACCLSLVPENGNAAFLFKFKDCGT